MKLSHWLTDYFRFSRKESMAVLALFVLIFLVLLFPVITGNSTAPRPSEDSTWSVALQQLVEKEEQSANNGFDKPSYADNGNGVPADKYRHSPYSVRGELFSFDPNTLTEEGWKKLGLRDKTIHTILNYREHGGRFRKPEDVQRIYGLFPDEYARIAPYITIASGNEAPSGKTYTESPPLAKQYPGHTSGHAYSIVDINSTDSNGLVPLPGIGAKLAARILNFRDKLGGFYHVNQVGETFGLPDSTFQKIKPYLRADAGRVKKININTASADELKTHPYIRWAIANAIVSYRNEHGPFGKLEDLKKVLVFTDAIYIKMIPYLEL
ncbi:MAG: helix-hairpin-helix domain-containing protein [Bacteroidetes bacterium]|nr:helix-hairpin-helix domain-containing protein [Bacteroidota bacterium]